jgi:hypothetical protein
MTKIESFEIQKIGFKTKRRFHKIKKRFKMGPNLVPFEIKNWTTIV